MLFGLPQSDSAVSHLLYTPYPIHINISSQQ
jgi:hypothetical protein